MEEEEDEALLISVLLLTGDGELVDGMLAAVVKIVMSHWRQRRSKISYNKSICDERGRERALEL